MGTPARTGAGRLMVVTGAPGVGKSAVLPALVGGTAGEPDLVVLEMDDLLTDGELLGRRIDVPEAAPIWPAYRAVWARIIMLIRRSGVDLVFLCPLLPHELEPLVEGGAAIPWLLLDCSDGVRRRRLHPRTWPDAEVEAALADAAEYRRVLADRPRTDHLVTDDLAPPEVAERLLAWVTRWRAGGA